MAHSGKNAPNWIRLSGLGLELVGAIVGFALIGYWVDRRFSTGPWGVLSGVGLGILGGMYNVIRESLRASKEADEDAEGGKRSGP